MFFSRNSFSGTPRITVDGWWEVMTVAGISQDAGWPVPERILRWAARGPDRPAIVDGNLTLSYGRLAARVGRLAGRLRALGAGRDSVVAIYLPRSAELVVAATAVLVAGAGYLALDIGQPFTRTRRMLHDSGAKYLVTMSKLWSINGDAGPVPVYVDDRGPAGDPPMAPPPPDPASLAYVAYGTDPSTEPVGALIEHAGLTNMVDWFGECHDVTVRDRIAQLASPASDAFPLEVWSCLAHGATLHLGDRTPLAQPDRLFEWLAGADVTLCCVPAELVDPLLHRQWPATGQVRGILAGGDRLAGYPSVEPPFLLYQRYGYAECAVVATCGPVHAAPDRPDRPPIGRPIPGVTAYVLDAELRQVADGQPGRLYLSGPVLARGYLRSSGQVPARFVPDPFVGTPGARMYATDDVVRRDADGVLHVVGTGADTIETGPTP
jgi:non-ribosomal peptide synthetase component F